MKKREIKQKEVAEWLGVSPSFLSRLCNGKKRVSPAEASRLEGVSGIYATSWLYDPPTRLERKIRYAYIANGGAR